MRGPPHLGKRRTVGIDHLAWKIDSIDPHHWSSCPCPVENAMSQHTSTRQNHPCLGALNFSAFGVQVRLVPGPTVRAGHPSRTKHIGYRYCYYHKNRDSGRNLVSVGVAVLVRVGVVEAVRVVVAVLVEVHVVVLVAVRVRVLVPVLVRVSVRVGGFGSQTFG